MLHDFMDHAGRRWRAETSGLSHDGNGVRSVGVWFTDVTGGVRFYGSLNPADATQPTDERLLQALHQALRTKLADRPIVIKLQADPESFHINSESYIQFVRDPAFECRAGYIASERLVTMDEIALRDELQRLGYDDDDTHAAIALARLTFSG